MRKIQLERQPKSFFLRVKCNGCGNEQIIFSSASKAVRCLGCDNILAESGPGKVNLKAKMLSSF